MLKKIDKALLIIFLLALLLRLAGINHGYPFVFHPDEPSVVRSALGVRFNPNPEHFDWPHLQIYLNYFLFMIFARIRTVLGGFSLQNILPVLWDEPFIFYSISRIFAALMGALTVVPVYLAAKNLFNRRVGLLAALVLALTPFHVWHSHYTLIDVPMTFWLSWALYFSVKILKSGKPLDYLLSGFFVGFSASTKYNGGFGALMIPLAHVFYCHSNQKPLLGKNTFLNLFLSGLAAIIGFLLGTPFALLDFATFSRTDGPQGAFWQFTNVGKVDFLTHLKQFFEMLAVRLANDFGYTFVAVFLGLFIYLLVRRKFNKELIFLYVLAITAVYYISGFSKTRSHYFMICYPFIAILAGYGIHILTDRTQITRNHKKIIMAIVFMIPFIFSIYKVGLFVREDTRIALYNWLSTSISPGDRVYYFDGEDFRTVAESLEGVSSDRLNDISELPAKKTGDYAEYLILNIKDSVLVSNYSFLQRQLELDDSFRRGPPLVVYEF